MATDSLARLKELLAELFQFGSADLDFGIYRIMKRKRAEVDRFLDTGLVKIVDDALSGGLAAQRASLASQLEEVAEQIRQNLAGNAISAGGELKPALRETNLGRRYEELRTRAEGAVDLESLKGIVFNHVHTFFGRYYERGDFLSKRRYSRRQRYAVPYNGEEVYLHWANADQYYVKTAEHFTDYRYTTADGVAVRFELIAASTERNNVKGDRRFFIPRLSDLRFEERARELTVPFEYRLLNEQEAKTYGKQGQQEKIVEQVVEELQKRLTKNVTALAVVDPSDLLRKHLNRYTRRNTSDYFVHKDLKRFLEQELDFYLKNEVLFVDDLDASGPERAEGWFEVMRAVKSVGREIISFLAQIEDFQKKLFEKRKFVVHAGYCLTLDRIPEDLYPRIVGCDKQYEEWERLFAISEIPPDLENSGDERSVEWLKANPNLVLDTGFFDQDFEDLLLARIEDLDERTDGLLINSENFQALNLLRTGYREQVKCVYIDPPYNTGGDGFLYKDSYQHSSWMSMMVDRLHLGREVLLGDSVFLTSIDDVENAVLEELSNNVFGMTTKIAKFVWQSRQTPDARNISGVSVDHEYILAYAKGQPRFKGTPIDESKYSNPDNDPRGPWMSDNMTGLATKEQRPNLHYDIVDPKTGGIYPPLPSRGWAYKRERMHQMIEDDEILWPSSPTGRPRQKRFLWQQKKTTTGFSSVLRGFFTTNGTREVQDLFGAKAYYFPKAVGVIRMVLDQTTDPDKSDIVLDYFAGSGTTGHAVIDLNRGDGGDRKYILVEMGEYFETVMKPRIMKVIYSKDWRDGKPVSREGTSHAFKYMKLESYEDALDNVSFTHEGEAQEALKLYGDDYLLRYMLDFETRDTASLLNVEKLASPFDYKLKLYEDGETRSIRVDLPETFVYLLGMRVATRKAYHDGERRYLVYRGATTEHDDVAVVWRDTAGWGVEELKHDRAFVSESGMVEGAQELLVNGDSLIPYAKPLDATFKRLMLPEETL